MTKKHTDITLSAPAARFLVVLFLATASLVSNVYRSQAWSINSVIVWGSVEGDTSTPLVGSAKEASDDREVEEEKTANQAATQAVIDKVEPSSSDILDLKASRISSHNTTSASDLLETKKNATLTSAEAVAKQEGQTKTADSALTETPHQEKNIEKELNAPAGIHTTPEYDDAPPYRFCNKTSFSIPRLSNKQPPIDFEMQYRCNGTEYDEFAPIFQNFVQNSSKHAQTWGRRPHALPDNTAVLFMGNSHTKQTMHNLLCMYSDQIVDNVGGKNQRSTSYQFANNSTIWLVFNSRAEASSNWTQSIETYMGRPLASFDAFVLGQFNKANKEIENTTFYKEMMNWSLHDPDMDFGKIDPPDIIQVAAVFSKPIVFASNFDIGREKMAKSILRAIDDIKKQSGRTNIEGILSRKYIPLLNNTECGTNDSVGRCQQRLTAHRCSAPKGGHPSLIAWDIQEALFEMLDKASRISSHNTTASDLLETKKNATVTSDEAVAKQEGQTTKTADSAH
jgi:hypothetical protein